MKIGVFSDVHGHLNELHQTLALFEKHRVNQIICCGDLVDKGSDSDGVVTVMREKSIACVLGNHDAKAQYAWLTYNIPLKPKSLDYLSKLPKNLSLQWGDVSVHVCHANPWHDYSVYVFPDRPKALFDLVLDAVEEQLVIMGHTHHPMRVDIDGRTILNAGSIYGNRDRPQRTCAILTLPEIDFQLYDVDTGEKLGL